jgi:hypothetical protein
MLSWLDFISPSVPLRPIFSDRPSKSPTVRVTEMEVAFNRAIDTDRQYEEDKDDDIPQELQYFEEERFHDRPHLPRGLTHVVQELRRVRCSRH